MALPGSPRVGTRPHAPTPSREESIGARRHLRVVPPQREGVARGRRQARLLLVISALSVVAAIFVIGMGQNLLGTQQIRLDSLNQQLSSAMQTNENLLLSRAQLEAPARILQLAEHRLGMVTPASVVYLTPVATGPTVAAKGKESVGVTP